ncbi:MAG: DUF2812 domain-containing protein [Bacillota bacterium]
MKNNKTVYKLCPCPVYDIEGVESFLCDMAKEGLILKESGFIAGVFSFEKTHSKNLSYRLEGIATSPSIWSGDMGEPDSEAVETSRQLGWEYITKFHDFHIYVSENAGQRELNTDPAVQAIAINEVKKRQFSSVIFALVWFVIYPLLRLNCGLFNAMIEIGTVWFAILAIAILYCVATSVVSYVHLAKLKTRLQNGEGIDHGKDWRKGRQKYFLAICTKILAIILIACIMVGVIFGTIGDKENGRVSLQEYSDSFKFATLADFAGEVDSYSPINEWGSSNSVFEWSDVLAPYNAEYQETATIKTVDGKSISASLYIDYHETQNAWLANQIANEYYKQAKQSDYFEEIEISNSEVDYISAYYEMEFFKCVIIQKDNVVINLRYFEHSESNTIDIEDLVDVIVAGLT